MDPYKCTEKELLNACFQGDKTAWDAFVEKYTDLIYHTIHKTLRMYFPDFLYQDLEDVHNSIFLSLIENDYKKLRQYKGINGCTVSSWLMVIAMNTTLNFIKKEAGRLNISLDFSETGKAILDTIPHPMPTVIDEIVESEQIKLLKKLMEGLNPSDRLFLKYYYEDDLPPEEIARIMNLSVSAIYSKKSRIIDKLQKLARKKNLLQEK